MLEESAEALSSSYDLLMFDVDGVVMTGGAAIPSAVEPIRTARKAGAHIAFVTNNASRPPATLASLLSSFGLDAHVSDVVTSAQAASSLAVRTYGKGARVALLGGAGLREAAAEAGLVAVEDWDEAVTLMSGYGPDVTWNEIRDAARLVANGLPYIASNTDASMSTPEGIAPGHGVLVDMISRFAGVEPTVAGKPSPPLLEETMARVGGKRALMVGDRLDTDIAGAHAVGVGSLLVMTGVTDVECLVAAEPGQRPSYIGNDLSALNEPAPVPAVDEAGLVRLGGWEAAVLEGELSLRGVGRMHDLWRVVATAAWRWADEGGRAPSVHRLVEALPALVGAER